MVQAILEGNKSQTRRAIKFPKSLRDSVKEMMTDKEDPNLSDYVTLTRMQHGWEDEIRPFWEYDDEPNAFSSKCPYGKPGDLLWVRETWYYSDDMDEPYGFKADQNEETQKHLKGEFKPSIHMPKEAARIWLEVVSVKVERVQDISETDAIKEGVEQLKEGIFGYKSYAVKETTHGVSPYVSFKTLWQKINGRESWDANPWVWVLEFKQIKK
jgi:hypothetical protein